MREKLFFLTWLESFLQASTAGGTSSSLRIRTKDSLTLLEFERRVIHLLLLRYTRSIPTFQNTLKKVFNVCMKMAEENMKTMMLSKLLSLHQTNQRTIHLLNISIVHIWILCVCFSDSRIDCRILGICVGPCLVH